MTLLRIAILFCFLTDGSLFLQNSNGGYECIIWNTRPLFCADIQCSEPHRIQITEIYGTLIVHFDVSDTGEKNLLQECQCRQTCTIPRMNTDEKYKLWTLHLEYQCKDTSDCSSTTSSRRTETTYPTTSTTVTYSTGVDFSPSTNETAVPEKVSSASTPLSTGDYSSTASSRSTENAYPVTSTTETPNISDVFTASTNEVTMPKTSKVTLESTTLSEEVTNVLGTATYSDNTTLFTSKEPPFDLYSKPEKKNSTMVIAVCVTAFVFVLAGCVAAFILYGRWRTKRAEESVYQNGSTVTKEKDVGFTNRTYSKSLDEDNVKDDDTHSHSGDSGYTDMHTDDTLDDTNNDYNLIKDGIEEITKNANDDYYAIKDNDTNEYNKIVFSPKLIPDDPNYGHTHFVANTKDKTYDHVDGKDLKVNASVEDTVLQDDDYSHLNQNKRHVNTNMRNIPLGKTIENDNVVSELNKEGNGNKSAHEYFILEQNESSTQAEFHKQDDDSHKYFVLDKEIITNDKQKNVEDFSKLNGNLNATPVVNGCGLSDDLMDHTYFETCQRVDTAADTHQYLAIEARVLESKSDPVEDENHDYFVLEKETKA